MAHPDTETHPDTEALPEPLVRCVGLSIGYANAAGEHTAVVTDVSFTVAPGEALGIVGESGSGKSTLARALLAYRRAGSTFLAGSLVFRGTDLVAADAATIAGLRGRSVAMVPQNPLSSLTHHMTVGRQVTEVLRTRAGLDRPGARQRMIELLTRTGLPDPVTIASRYPHQLSGGQRQRVVIAAALACDPALLVLDEPTTALDKTTEAQVLALIAELRRDSGAALVLVTHDLNVVARVCDRVLVMKDGRLIEQGPVRQVFSSPASAYSRELLEAARMADHGPRPAATPATPATPTGEPSAPVLEIDGLGFSYTRPPRLMPRWLARQRTEAAPTLAAVDLRIGRGEVLGVIGESGSGKTTLGLIIAGLMAADEGRLRFEGGPLAGRVAARSREQRRRIQVIFQDPLSSLNPRHTVGSALIRPLRLFFGLDRDAARARATTLLAQLGMGPEFLGRFARQLSGGQQQRVAIARAFAAEPDLLICDEITSALDASIQSQVLAQLLALQQRSAAAMLVITHDLAVVSRVAPRVIVLRHGRIVEAGDTESVFRDPRDAYTASLLESATLASRAKR